MENSTKRSSQGFDEPDGMFKRKKSISDMIPMKGLHMNDNGLHETNMTEEEDSRELVHEEEIHQTYQQDEGSHRFTNGLRKVRDGMFSFLNNIAESILQEPSQMKDIGTSLHMDDGNGNGKPVGIRLEQSKNGGLEICHVENDSVAKNKLRIGDRILKVNEHCLLTKKIEDIKKIFFSKSLVITIKREVIVENESHTVEFKCRITFDDTVKMVFESLDKCGKYKLWSSSVQRKMCLFREDYKFGDEKKNQYFVRCMNTQVSAGKFDETTSSLDFHKLLMFPEMTKEVWILQHNNKYITVNKKKEIELTDGQAVGGLAVCDGRAFTYKTYPAAKDSFLIESLQFPQHYLAINGNSVELLQVNDFTTIEAHKCQLEIISVKSAM